MHLLLIAFVLSACTADLVTEADRPHLTVGADTLLGVHFAGDPDDPDLDVMLDGRRGFAVELVYADEVDEGQLHTLRRIAARGLTVILRIDPSRGQVVPLPGDEDAFASFVADGLVPALEGAVSIFVVGNEPNLDIECRQSGGYCAPASYVDAYRRVRAAVHARPEGRDATVLVTATSPGGAFGPRVVDGDEYFAEVLSALAPEEVDGIAVHAYGGPGDVDSSLQDFADTMTRQLSLFAGLGHGAAPIFVTEMNRASEDDADEVTSARFLGRAYAWLDAWNRSGGAPVVGAAWFEYADSPDWTRYSLRGRKSGEDDDDSLAEEDLWHAFRAAARAGYAPGATWSAEPEPQPEPDPAGSPPSDACECRPWTDNVCLYGVRAEGCLATWPVGYCDPNGDGDFSDADWVRGWYEHRDLCGLD